MIEHKRLTAIIDKLFDPESRRLNVIVVSLNRENKRLSGTKLDGFLVEGEFIRPTTGTLLLPGRGQAKPMLHSSLYERGLAFLKDRAIVERERSAVQQMLFILLLPCQGDQDIRDALPECLVSLDGDLVNLRRQRETAWTLESNERLIPLFEQILPKIETYAAGQFFY